MQLPVALFSATLWALIVGCGDPGPTGPGARDTVLVAVPSIAAIAIGDSAAFSAYLSIDGTDSVGITPTWSSSDEGIVAVSPAGVAHGVATGNATVVGTAHGLSDTIAVTVTPEPLPLPALRLVATSPSGAFVHATAPPSDSTRVYAVAQQGVVYVVRNDTLLPAPFLDIRDSVVGGGERGLLSIAFHPDFATNGFVFVSYTTQGGHSRVKRYTATGPESVDPASGLLVLALDQPYSNHNGGQIAFGPDDMLYVGFGDGGSAGDPLGAGQDRGTLLGALLRLDVDAGAPYAVPADNPFVGDPDARDEIWAWGLRNPWRFSFDRLTGDLYLADVGQNAWEEIEVQLASSAGGENYGWNVMEGRHCYNASACDTSGKVLPVLEYPHPGGCSVTGGFVYRGSDVPILAGRYLYADYCAGWVRSFSYSGGQAHEEVQWDDLAPPGGQVTSFGEDARGEVYVTTGGGRLYRIVSQ